MSMRHFLAASVLLALPGMSFAGGYETSNYLALVELHFSIGYPSVVAKPGVPSVWKRPGDISLLKSTVKNVEELDVDGVDKEVTEHITDLCNHFRDVVAFHESIASAGVLGLRGFASTQKRLENDRVEWTKKSAKLVNSLRAKYPGRIMTPIQNMFDEGYMKEKQKESVETVKALQNLKDAIDSARK